MYLISYFTCWNKRRTDDLKKNVSWSKSRSSNLMKKLRISKAVAKYDNSCHCIHIPALSTPTQELNFLPTTVVVITLIWVFWPLAENLKSKITRRIPLRPVKKIHGFYSFFYVSLRISRYNSGVLKGFLRFRNPRYVRLLRLCRYFSSLTANSGNITAKNVIERCRFRGSAET
jgi:hypothetical protein